MHCCPRKFSPEHFPTDIVYCVQCYSSTLRGRKLATNARCLVRRRGHHFGFQIFGMQNVSFMSRPACGSVLWSDRLIYACVCGYVAARARHLAVFMAPWGTPPPASPQMGDKIVKHKNDARSRAKNAHCTGYHPKKTDDRISKSLLLSLKVDLCSTLAICRLQRFATACDGLRHVQQRVTSQKAEVSVSLNRSSFSRLLHKTLQQVASHRTQQFFEV